MLLTRISKIQSKPTDMVIVRRNSILGAMGCQDSKLVLRSSFKAKGVESRGAAPDLCRRA